MKKEVVLIERENRMDGPNSFERRRTVREMTTLEAAPATSRRRRSPCLLRALAWTAIAILQTQFTGVSGLKNVRVVSPGAVAVGETVSLQCQYDLEGAELYAVKWYKGKKEFYRYLPKEDPPTKVFPLPGINVDLSESDAHHVVLRDAGFTLTGRYRCEVSADAPSFDTALVVASLVIVDFPDGEPIITAERSSYAVGEMVRANCTAQRSHPPANLTWSVNGRQVRGRHVRRYPLRRDEGNATTTTLGLEVEAGSGTFRRGRLTLRCQATLLSAYNASAELVIEEERPRLASVLGTRESSSAPASGAAPGASPPSSSSAASSDAANAASASSARPRPGGHVALILLAAFLAAARLQTLTGYVSKFPSGGLTSYSLLR